MNNLDVLILKVKQGSSHIIKHYSYGELFGDIFKYKPQDGVGELVIKKTQTGLIKDCSLFECSNICAIRNNGQAWGLEWNTSIL